MQSGPDLPAPMPARDLALIAFSRLVDGLRRSPLLLALTLGAWLTLLSGCHTVPPQHTAVDAVDVSGNEKLASADVVDVMATSPSPKFLGLFQGFVYDYELFDRFVFQKDLERVERYYRARGYYQAHARAGRILATKKQHVRVDVAVDEGKPILLKEIKILESAKLDPKLWKDANKAMFQQIALDKPFDEDQFANAETAVRRAFTDHGYAFTQTLRRAEVDLPNHRARAVIEVYPGEKAVFGKVTIEGMGDLNEGRIRLAIDIKEGEPYSTEKIDSARQSVLDLGAFSSADVIPTLGDSPTTVVPVTVKLEQTKLHAVTLGGGIEFDVVRTDLHLMAGWEDRNFLGGFRHFRVTFKPGVELYPTTVSQIVAPTHLLPEFKLRAELIQPGVIERKTNGVLRGELNYFPVIFPPNVDRTALPVLGYKEAKGAVGLERTFWKFFVSPTYNIQLDQPFAYLSPPCTDTNPNSAQRSAQPGAQNGCSPPVTQIYSGGLTAPVSTVILSYIDLDVHFDARNDPVHARKGFYVDNDLQLAGLGGTGADIREQPELRVYIPLGKRVTLALRGTVGFLWPTNYGSNLINGTGGQSEAGQALRDQDAQILLFRGFYSGGSSDNRGYPLRSIGPHYAVPFLNPSIATNQNTRGCSPNPTNLASVSQDCKVPIGGESIWEANAELRVNVKGPLSVAAFCDTSNVSSTVGEFFGGSDPGAKAYNERHAGDTQDFPHVPEGSHTFLYPHLSCGPGIRYDTPVGPIRLDVAYRIGGIDPANESTIEGIFGLNSVPIAIAFGIGESF
jgi:outer membrane protein assembly factor BamA